MQPTAAPPRAPASPSFAGLLADFARPPEKKFPPAREDGGFAEDVATLSYESALRSHARYRPAIVDPELPPGPVPVSIPSVDIEEPVAAAAEIATEPSRVASPILDFRTALELSRKCASVTVRLSQPENLQLRDRAAESGLTVSAYLRSCAFEVESLRAQVKQAMAELRSPAIAASQPARQTRPTQNTIPWWRSFLLYLADGIARP